MVPVIWQRIEGPLESEYETWITPHTCLQRVTDWVTPIGLVATGVKSENRPGGVSPIAAANRSDIRLNK
jgi:hypothetical protein